MKNMFIAKSGDRFRSPARQRALFLVAGMMLITLFWAVSAPIAAAERFSPKQMIESQLPREKSIITAKKPELLSAVCGSIRRWHNMAEEIVTAASASHSKWTKAIVQESIRCLANVDCEMVVRLTGIGVSGSPDDASDILDIAIAAAPDCRSALDQLFSPPAEGPDGLGKLPNPSNFVAGGGGVGLNPQETTVTVCDNNAAVQLPPSRVAAYIASHPGSFAGSCQPTPVTNK